MARRVFFSFHYKNDIWRVNQVRKAHAVVGTAAAGFQDASLWEKAKQKGSAELKRMINAALEGTTVTVVLIGEETAYRDWVDYEINQSIERGNGLLGVRIHMLSDQDGYTSRRGPVPDALKDAGAPVYDWDRDSFGDWVEDAAEDAGY